MLRLKNKWTVAKKDVSIMSDFKRGIITAEIGAKLIAENNNSECTEIEFIDLCRRCGYVH